MNIPPAVSYSVRRLGLFAGTLVFLTAVLRGVEPILIFALAAITSGVLSYFFLAGPRAQMAGSLASRMTRLNARLDSAALSEDAAADAAERRADPPSD